MTRLLKLGRQEIATAMELREWGKTLPKSHRRGLTKRIAREFGVHPDYLTTAIKRAERYGFGTVK